MSRSFSGLESARVTRVRSRRSPSSSLQVLDPEGFTLLEVLVAMTILAIVLVSTYATLVQTRTAIDRAESTVASEEVGHQAVALFAALLESAYFQPQRPELAFVGASAGHGGESADSVELASVPGQVLPLAGPAGEPARCRIELRVTPRRERLLLLEAGSSADPRRASPTFVLSTEISGLDLAFLAPDGWVEAFDSNHWKGLPAAVRIRVYREGTLAASRVVTLPLAESHPARRPEP